MQVGQLKGNDLGVFCNLFIMLLNCFVTLSSDKSIFILVFMTSFCLGFLFKKVIFSDKIREDTILKERNNKELKLNEGVIPKDSFFLKPNLVSKKIIVENKKEIPKCEIKSIKSRKEDSQEKEVPKPKKIKVENKKFSNFAQTEPPVYVIPIKEDSQEGKKEKNLEIENLGPRKYSITRRVSQVSCSAYFCIFVSKGKVKFFGKNRLDDELRVGNLENIKSAACGYDHCAFLDFDGNVFTVGSNSMKQLGTERDCKYLLSPEQLSLPAMKQVDCGYNFTIVLSEEGELYSFGCNIYGQLGRNLHSKKISSLQNIEFVVCGSKYVVCKAQNNDIFSWGENSCGQLGLGHFNDQSVPVKCNWPKNIVDIKCGDSHTLVLTDELEVFSCGDNSHGALGREIDEYHSPTLEKIDTLSEIVRIECGNTHSMCINVFDELIVFGDNSLKQLGIEDCKKKIPTKHSGVSNIIDISSGGSLSFVKNVQNEIFGFGYNTRVCGSNGYTPVVKVFDNQEDLWISEETSIKSNIKSARSAVA